MLEQNVADVGYLAIEAEMADGAAAWTPAA